MKKDRLKLVMGGALAMATLPWLVSPANAGPGWAPSTNKTGGAIKVPTYYANSPAGNRLDPLDPLGLALVYTGTPLRKFVDGLPGIPGVTSYNSGPLYNVDGTNLNGQVMPLAKADTTSYPGSRYYVIGVVEYTARMHTDLPKATTLRGYVQLESAIINNAVTPGISKHVALTYPNGSPILDAYGAQIYAVDQPNYLGPVINTTTGTPVRITYTNLLPTGHFNAGQRFGDLFLPVDTSLMGAGAGPLGAGELYTENRIAIHHHGGDTPWISDGTPSQWTVPRGEATSYKIGDSFALVPDMADPGEGSGTLYYPGEISGRLMFYHDHAIGLTRLNVYGGMAAGYLIGDKPGLGENRLIAAGVLPTDQIPLVIQEKTFVPADVKAISATDGTTPVGQDEKWDVTHWGQPGDLWYPNVYEALQDPNSFDGTNPPGRWDYGPWLFPVVPAAAALPTGEYGNPSTTPEAFSDTSIVNGTAYPVLNVDPKAYRFRVLSAGNDRMLNLGLYVAASKNSPTTAGTTGAILCDGVNVVPVTDCTEVKMVPFSAPNVFPASWGQPDGRVGGVQDPATAGPDIIQIGSEGGFLPAAKVFPSTPANFDYGNSLTVLNVQEHGFLLGPGERADAVIDFSQFAGKTLILFNDAPAPLPGEDPRYNYFTGNPDQSAVGGAPSTLPGYGPNTRTVMQINVAAVTPVPFVAANLINALPQAYADVQPKPVVAELVYNAAFGNTDAPIKQYGRIFTGWINEPAFTFQTGDAVTYFPFVPNTTTIATTAVTIPEGGTAVMPVYNKAIQESFDPNGRLNATLGIEIPFTGAKVETTVGLAYIDPVTEVISDGETQIWKITHNGVDAHPVHFHLVNVQVINRVGWDGTIKGPDANELGWKETVRMNPLEDVFVAVRANAPKLPFGVPNSVRPLNPAEPLNSTVGFSAIDPKTGNPYPPQNATSNVNTNFGWEYVWHCHILGHEENDFMRPMVFKFKSLRPLPVTGVTATPRGTNRMDVSWIDPTPISNPTTYGDHSNEIGFIIERSTFNGPFMTLAYVLANQTSYIDMAAISGSTYHYRVVAYNAAGESPLPVGIGAYVDGNWYLDANANGAWEPGTDFNKNFGGPGMIPVVGDWEGDGLTEVGVYDNGTWYFDMNGNGLWDGVPTDRMITGFGGAAGDIPVVGDWNGDGVTEIGIYNQVDHTWHLDYDGNFIYNPTGVDVTASFGFDGCVPVAGDWNGNGHAKIGVYYNGQWYLDTNGDFAWEWGVDTFAPDFGFPEALPVVGDWTGSGVDRIGVYSNGDWYLDMDGNGAWNPPTDKYMGPFGSPGMVPMVGNWK